MLILKIKFKQNNFKRQLIFIKQQESFEYFSKLKKEIKQRQSKHHKKEMVI